jgi:hypothetical protein
MPVKKTHHSWTVAEQRALIHAADEVRGEMKLLGITRLTQRDLARAAAQRAGLEGISLPGVTHALGRLLRDRKEAQEDAARGASSQEAASSPDPLQAVLRLLNEQGECLLRIEDRLQEIDRRLTLLESPRQLKLAARPE